MIVSAIVLCMMTLSPPWIMCSVLESPSRLDEEHRLIARYAARLAAEAGNSTVSGSQDAVSPHSVSVRL